MAKRVVFTIVAKNYLGLAGILADSIKANSSDTEFIAFIADEIDAGITLQPVNFKYYIAKDVLPITGDTWNELAFKYNITEFCTAIKPFCFSFLFDEHGAENIIYFDPDILVFSSLQPVWVKLLVKDFIVTPHIVAAEANYSGVFLETNFLASGVFNLGFIALRRTATTGLFIEWWKNRLLNKCFIDKIEGLYTDQKWMDFLPCLFDNEKIEVSKNLGMNVAPWNFYEREFTKEDDGWYIANRVTRNEKHRLVFMHFSGFNYKEPDANALNNKNIPFLKIYDDVLPVLSYYLSIIQKSTISNFFSYSYTYNCFDNGKPVLHFHRRLYRRLLADENITGNPFSTTAKDGFYAILNNASLVLEAGDESVDKLNERNFENFDSKLYKVNVLHKLLKKVVGAKAYFLFSKFMSRYHRTENQVFLLGKKYMKTSFKSERY